MTTGILVLGHGSRDAAANAEFEALVDGYRSARPALDIAHGYVELADPLFAVALQELARRVDQVVVLPLFLFAAGHVKHDVPLALEQATSDFPAVRFMAARALGVHPTLIEIARERARSVLGDSAASHKTALIAVGRGSSDADANSDFYKVARLLAEGEELAWLLPSFIGITWPLFEDAVELVLRSRPDRIVVVPYFLFAGRLIERLRSQVDALRARYPWVRFELAAHLGIDERLWAVFDERLSEARVHEIRARD
jgi:sirohydrochlorin ferrochelatase